MSSGTPGVPAPPGARPLLEELAALRRYVRLSIFVRGLAVLAIALGALVLFSLAVDRFFRLSQAGRAVALAVYAVFFLRLAWQRLVRPLFARLTPGYLASLIEARYPELEDRLRSAVDFLQRPAQDARPEAEHPVTRAFKERVIEEAQAALGRVRTDAVVDTARVVSALAGAGAVIAVYAFLVAFQGPALSTWFQRQILLADLEWPYRTHLEVLGFEGGKKGVPRGDPLAIRARASGEIPSRVTIELRFAGEVSRRNMALEGGSTDTFVYEHPAVTEPFAFAIEGGDYRTPLHAVEVLERPVVEELALVIRPPEYTGLEERRHEGDLGEVPVPEGSAVGLVGRANKPLAAARLQAGEAAVPLTIDPADPSATRFSGSWRPEKSGPVTIHLEDREGVPPDRNFRFSVHIVEDKPPVVEARAAGLGGLITPHARMPLSIRAEDDYRVGELFLEWTAAGESGEERKGAVDLAPPEEPGRRVEAERVWEVRESEAQPGSRLNVRVGARDNDGIHGAKAGYSPILGFLVVTAERLSEEFLRREEEQRRILERLLEEERKVRDEVYLLIDSAWKKEGALEAAALDRTLALARAERQHARQLLAIAHAIEELLHEMENNRVGEADDLNRLARLIIDPLEELGNTDVPAIAARFSAVREAPAAEARVAEGLALADGLERKIEKIERVLAHMARLEGFTEIVKNLRGIIKTHEEATRATREVYRREVDELFLPEEDTDGAGSSPKVEEGGAPRSNGR